MNRFCKLVSVIIFFFFLMPKCFSQDVITMRTGEDILSKVFEVTTTELKYKKYDNPNGPIFIIPKSDVLMVRYENGTKDIFLNEKRVEQVPVTAQTPVVVQQSYPSQAPVANQAPVMIQPSGVYQPYVAAQPTEDLFMQGQMDASKYYRGYKGAGTWTFFATLLPNNPLTFVPGLGLLPGLITAIACSSSDPKEINMNYPSRELMKKADYYNGYTQRAKKIKQGKVWTNFGISIGIAAASFLLLQ